MSGLTLVPKAGVDYRFALIDQLREAAAIEARDAIESLASGTLDMAELALHRAQLLVKFAEDIGTQKR
jgi:hypothetical protein